MDIQKLYNVFHGEFPEKPLMDCQDEDYVLWHASEAGKEYRAGNNHNALILWQNARWPFTCIDWTKAAEDLAGNYTSFGFDGVEYLAREA